MMDKHEFGKLPCRQTGHTTYLCKVIALFLYHDILCKLGSSLYLNQQNCQDVRLYHTGSPIS